MLSMSTKNRRLDVQNLLVVIFVINQQVVVDNANCSRVFSPTAVIDLD